MWFCSWSFYSLQSGYSSCTLDWCSFCLRWSSWWRVVQGFIVWSGGRCCHLKRSCSFFRQPRGRYGVIGFRFTGERVRTRTIGWSFGGTPIFTVCFIRTSLMRCRQGIDRFSIILFFSCFSCITKPSCLLILTLRLISPKVESFMAFVTT